MKSLILFALLVALSACQTTTATSPAPAGAVAQSDIAATRSAAVGAAPQATRSVSTASVAPAVPVSLPVDAARFQKEDCYTVDLFKEVVVEADPSLPEAYARYVGFWAGGNWNGDWCHDMIVTKVLPDGTAFLVDMHGPHETYGIASIFKRKARIHEDGSLRFAHDLDRRRYDFVDGKLYGVRESTERKLEVVLAQKTSPMVRVEAVAPARERASEVAPDIATVAAAAPVSADPSPTGSAVAAAAPVEVAAAPASTAVRAAIAPLPPVTVPPGIDERRVALLIGNGAYQNAGTLANPRRDTVAIGEALRAVGFEVIQVLDADFEAFRKALSAFRDKAALADVAVLYYAGHGIEVNSQNFLIPVDAQLETIGDVRFETMPLDLLRAATEDARRLGLVIVDACRNNPFVERLPSNSRSMARGLAKVEPTGRDRLVAFAAREGTVALDGDGENSPYAAALIDALSAPGLEIGKLFRRVRDRVLEATGGQQEPAVYGSLSEQDFFFRPPVIGALGAGVAVPAAKRP